MNVETYISKIIEKTGLTRNEIKSKVWIMKRRYKGLITDEGALFLTAKESVIVQEISATSLKTYFKNIKERKIFANNLASLACFKFFSDYKYCMIAMGSILEFLLITYCRHNNIIPSGVSDPKFYHYIKEAIDKDIFGQKKRWKLVQDYIRDFRNYVHIEKEVNSDYIDKSWYETMKPVFKKLYGYFKSTSL